MEAIPRVEPRPDRLKKCSGRCREWLPVICFDRDRQRPDGRRSVCRACRREREAQLERGAKRLKPWARRRTVHKRCLELGLNPSTVRQRLHDGLTVKQALERPVKSNCGRPSSRG